VQGDRARAYPKDRATILKAIQEKIGADNVTYVPGTTIDHEVDVAKAVKQLRKRTPWRSVSENGPMRRHRQHHRSDAAEGQLLLVHKNRGDQEARDSGFDGGAPAHHQPHRRPAKAILMAYNPGNEGGQAIADILFGDVNPSGKLPITYPRWPNRLFTYDHKVLKEEDWGEGKAQAAPQFEFGTGLSYTSFAYSDLLVTQGAQQVRGPLQG